MSKTEPLSIRLAPELKLALQEVAKQEHRNMNNMIEFLIIERCRKMNIQLDLSTSNKTKEPKGALKI
jgi:hypothetical protein